MKCPACFNELSSVQLSNVTVDACQGGCGGIWFDPFELQKVDQQHEPAGEPLLDLKRDERLIIDKTRKRECPRCPGIKLHRHFFSAKRKIEVDECPNCSGYWLDAGELAAIRDEKREKAAAEQVEQFSISFDVIRYVYRLQREEREC